MRNKFNTLIVVCGLAVVVCTPVSLACDKDAAVQCSAHRTTKTQVVEVKSGCSKSNQAKKASVVAASGQAACCPVTGKAVAVQASAVQGCPAERVMKQLVQAHTEMKSCGDAGCAGREYVVRAMRIMAEAKPELACDTVAKLLASESEGQFARTVVASAGGASRCGSTKGQVQAASGKAACDPSACSTQGKVLAAGNKACDPSTCSTKGKVVAAAGGSTCGSAASARYVAFNCEKTDRVARAAARAYLDLMRELKLSAGADGCAAKAASQVLASVVDEMVAEQTAAAGESIETVTEVEVVPVSLGAVGEKSEAPKRTCGSSRN